MDRTHQSELAASELRADRFQSVIVRFHAHIFTDRLRELLCVFTAQRLSELLTKAWHDGVVVRQIIGLDSIK